MTERKHESELNGRRVAFLATNGVEESELTEPLKVLKEAGAQVQLVGIDTADIRASKHGEPGETFAVDVSASTVFAKDYDALVLPGGSKNADALRRDQNSVAFVRGFFDEGKPVGAICHGPWTLAAADVLKGRTVTSSPKIQDDLRSAGASWVDEEVHVEDGLVTSRGPDDLPAFCEKLIEEIAEGLHDAQAKRTEQVS